MRNMQTSSREAQAQAEIGHTEIGRPTALGMSMVFLIVIASVVPMDLVLSRSTSEGAQPSAAESPLAIGVRFIRTAAADLRRVYEVGWIETDREIQQAMSDFETEVESNSVLRQRVLPPVQWQLAKRLGLGNEQAYLGRDGWLFYRPDVDYVIGRGFLEPEVLEARLRGGRSWEQPPQPNPLPALVDFQLQLESRGIDLLIVPVPVKPVIYPEAFSWRARRVEAAVQNSSFDQFLMQARDAGLVVFDPTTDLYDAKRSSEHRLYLRTDSHWSPAGLEVVSMALADVVRSKLGDGSDKADRWVRRSVGLEGFGDIARMLWVPAYQNVVAPDRVDAAMVVSRSGPLWRGEPDAPILLLGDSFSNVFSDAALGWGTSAGLAEQVSFYTGMAVDKIARNSGGALGARQALVQALRRDPSRLDGKRLLIYQFASRELAQGDWRRIELDPAP